MSEGNTRKHKSANRQRKNDDNRSLKALTLNGNIKNQSATSLSASPSNLTSTSALTSTSTTTSPSASSSSSSSSLSLSTSTTGLISGSAIKNRKDKLTSTKMPLTTTTSSSSSTTSLTTTTTSAVPQNETMTATTTIPAIKNLIKTQSKQVKNQKDKERTEREGLVLWRRPLQTTKYCVYELVALLKTYSQRLCEQRGLLAILLLLGVVLSILYCIPGPQQALIDIIRKNTWFFIYWIGLGVLSSVGLGTGLHTFLLYLGPHIASVTLAAYECNSVNFPKPPYPDDIICPEEPYIKQIPNIWTIMSKVRLEAFLWGAGTALGELPPYFMAKAARLSGYDPDDAEELAEFQALKAKRNQKNLSLMDRGKLFMERVVERVGFFGILACASIPNPLFDLAGITCGHFLVPFWTFFGATLIGKAIIKMHIQKVFVIIAFNETLIERAVDLLAAIPIIGAKLQEPFKTFLANQKKRLHRNKMINDATARGVTETPNLLSKAFETFVIGMVCYFIISIINSLAQSYHKRLHKKQHKSAVIPPVALPVTGARAGAGAATLLMKRSKLKVARD